jgi:hypothetical protein
MKKRIQFANEYKREYTFIQLADCTVVFKIYEFKQIPRIMSAFKRDMLQYPTCFVALKIR